ncbi:unnamed protein product [Staurois parvus]|uniref:Uncharacterized protein n=1 Tax=Staurois parvus TaxID=386267 RepID=A0ABN9BRS7_9NEOB|nr:unnamed protein product [Staurois parvus]
MGPIPPPHSLLPGPESLMGPLYGLPIAAVSIATLCHVPLSGLLTLLVVSIFVIGCCMASHCCCRSTATLWLHTLVLAP